MTWRKIRYFFRKNSLWIGLVLLAITVWSMYILDSFGSNPYLAIIPWIFFALLGFDTNMVMTGRDIFKVLGFFTAVLLVLFFWSSYNSQHDIFKVFTIDNIKIALMMLSFFAAAAFVFGYLPFKILSWKDRKIYNTAEFDSSDAALFIYRQLPFEIAQKTSDLEIQEMLNIFFEVVDRNKYIKSKEDNEKITSANNKVLRIYPKLNEGDLKIIMELEYKYEKEMSFL